MINVWNNVLKKGKPTMILGDLNIDRIENNDPKRRQDLKNLIPLLETFQVDNNIVLINKKPSRFRINQRPTLLDLVLTNKPELISETKNICNHCSEHDGIFNIIQCKSTTTNVQFTIRRDTRNLTPENLDMHIKNNIN